MSKIAKNPPQTARSIEKQAMLDLLVAAGPRGMSPEALVSGVGDVSRSTINRRLTELVGDGVIKPIGEGRSRRYVSAAPFTLAAIDKYFAVSAADRPLVPFDETLLQANPGIDADRATRLTLLQQYAALKTDRKFLSNFLIDMSFGSSLLEGGTYTDLDTQALIEYGQANQFKPVEDGGLVLNHKAAIEHLWGHREITLDNVCAMHSMLTDQHDLPALRESDHFLPPHQRGVPREYEDVNLQRSAYLPPFRPGTGFIARALNTILDTAKTLEPIAAAFYLMIRIPYLQAFANGNKRTARLAANLPLLKNGLLPISFVDFDRAEYIRGMAAFYELGSAQIIENVFIRGYVKSIIRGSHVPAELRIDGINTEAVAKELTAFVMKGSTPTNKVARSFLANTDETRTARTHIPSSRANKKT